MEENLDFTQLEEMHILIEKNETEFINKVKE